MPLLDSVHDPDRRVLISIFAFGMTVAFKELPWNGKATYAGKGI